MRTAVTDKCFTDSDLDICIIDLPGLPKWENFAECRSLGNEAHSYPFVEMSVRFSVILPYEGPKQKGATPFEVAPSDAL
jgi:hypothetical protein